MKLEILLDSTESPAKKHPSTVVKAEVVDLLKGGKKSKSDSNYRPSDSASCCIDCRHYDGGVLPQSSCAKVAGIVDGDAICDYYKEQDLYG